MVARGDNVASFIQLQYMIQRAVKILEFLLNVVGRPHLLHNTRRIGEPISALCIFLRELVHEVSLATQEGSRLRNSSLTVNE